MIINKLMKLMSFKMFQIIVQVLTHKMSQISYNLLKNQLNKFFKKAIYEKLNIKILLFLN